MIYKGNIIDINNNYAVVMTDKAEFYKVIKKEGLSLGKQIIFIDDDIYREKFMVKGIMKYAAAVIMLLVVSALFLTQYLSFYKEYYMPVAMVSVDINPSVELSINKDMIVIDVTKRNDEGEVIFNKNIVGKEIEEALYILLINAKSKGFITEEKNSVLIGIGKIDDKFTTDLKFVEDNLIEKLKGNEEYKYINMIFLQGDQEKNEISKVNDITIGKYLLYEKLYSEGSDLNLEDVKTMSTQELIMNSTQNRYRYQYQGNDFEDSKENNVNDITKDNLLNQDHNPETLTDNDAGEKYQYRQQTSIEHEDISKPVENCPMYSEDINSAPLNNDEQLEVPSENIINIPDEEQNKQQTVNEDILRESRSKRGYKKK